MLDESKEKAINALTFGGLFLSILGLASLFLANYHGIDYPTMLVLLFKHSLVFCLAVWLTNSLTPVLVKAIKHQLGE